KPLTHKQRVKINPRDPTAHSKKIVLKSTDGVYTQTKTTLDDKDKADLHTTVEFTHLLPGRKYTLEIDHGGGKIETVFKNQIIGEDKIPGPHVAVADAVKLKADVAPLAAPGTPATFKIFDADADEDEKPIK